MQNNVDDDNPCNVAVTGNKIYLFGGITDYSMCELAEFLSIRASLAKKGRSKQARVFMMSGGGALDAMFGAHDLVQMYTKNKQLDLSVVGVGKVQSAALLLYASFPKRLAGQNTTFMAHGISTSDVRYMNFKSIEVDGSEIRRQTHSYAALLTSYTKPPKKSFWFDQMTDLTDHYFSAQKAKSLGLVDIII